MFLKLLKAIFGVREKAKPREMPGKVTIDKPGQTQPIFDAKLNPILSPSDNKLKIINRAQSQGRALNLEFKNGKLAAAIPIEIRNQSVIFIDDDSHRQFLWNLDDFEIFGDGYSLEREDTIKQNLEDIIKRESDAVEKIEYWNDKLESVYAEDLIFISEDEYNITIRDIDAEKTYRIRKSFIRNITFEGQRKREMISKLDNPPGQYEGYKYFDLAKEMIDGRRYEEVVASNEADTILKLLQKTLNDKTISSNTQASVCRIMGEIFEVRSDRLKAIEYYERALSFNSKIGVKNKIKKLNQ